MLDEFWEVSVMQVCLAGAGPSVAGTKDRPLAESRAEKPASRVSESLLLRFGSECVRNQGLRPQRFRSAGHRGFHLIELLPKVANLDLLALQFVEQHRIEDLVFHTFDFTIGRARYQVWVD